MTDRKRRGAGPEPHRQGGDGLRLLCVWVAHFVFSSTQVLHTLAATQEVPLHTRLHSRGSTNVPPTSRGSPVPPPSSRGAILSLRGRERIPGVPVASQEEVLSTGKARGTPGSCHHSKSSPDVSVHSRGTCFPCTATTFTPRIVSHQGGMWDSPVGKPHGKALPSPPLLSLPVCPLTSHPFSCFFCFSLLVQEARKSGRLSVSKLTHWDCSLTRSLPSPGPQAT